MTANSVQLREVPTLLAQLQSDRFYGSLELKLESGEVVLIRKTETIKPNCRTNRGENVHAQRPMPVNP